MLKAIEKAQSIMLSDTDLEKFCDGKLNIVTNPDLNEFDNLDELLGEHGAVALLYETKREGNVHTGVRVMSRFIVLTVSG